MPQWTPGKQSGEPVRVKYTMPVTFRLQEGNGRVISIGEIKTGDKTGVVKATSIRSETSVGDDFAIEIDGVKTDKSMSEVLKELSSEDIESMTVVKSGVPKPIVIITTKKKQ